MKQEWRIVSSTVEHIVGWKCEANTKSEARGIFKARISVLWGRRPDGSYRKAKYLPRLTVLSRVATDAELLEAGI